MPASAGTKPDMLKPVESVRLRPTCPDELATFEFSSSRADSQALAATTTALHRTCFSVRVALSTYDTAVILPLPVTSSRAIAPVITVSLPVFMAGKIIAWLDENADAVWHP